MTAYCGVRRNGPDLEKLMGIIEGLMERVGPANPLITARLIAAGALAREESRGGHTRTDFADEVNPPRSTYITYDMLD